jgi:hypothetical protein
VEVASRLLLLRVVGSNHNSNQLLASGVSHGALAPAPGCRLLVPPGSWLLLPGMAKTWLLVSLLAPRSWLLALLTPGSWLLLTPGSLLLLAPPGSSWLLLAPSDSWLCKVRGSEIIRFLCTTRRYTLYLRGLYLGQSGDTVSVHIVIRELEDTVCVQVAFKPYLKCT